MLSALIEAVPKEEVLPVREGIMRSLLLPDLDHP
jgi:hypothetical protein